MATLTCYLGTEFLSFIIPSPGSKVVFVVFEPASDTFTLGFIFRDFDGSVRGYNSATSRGGQTPFISFSPRPDR